MRKKVSTGYVGSVKEEMKKVTWPSRREAISLTLVVFAISLIVGLYVGIIDASLAKLLEIITTS